eukprot:INCI5324.4.p1 GENE.INCI5324.4~~INCI5324.4.p1  ORF type:complete len:443 (-),score=67.61 INCI5324.4:26-1354(-)
MNWHSVADLEAAERAGLVRSISEEGSTPVVSGTIENGAAIDDTEQLGNSTKNANQEAQLGIVCAFTDTFRKLASQVVAPGDFVVEIGFSYAECSRVILKALGATDHSIAPDESTQRSNGLALSSYLGIDNSKQLRAKALALCPGADFRVFDVLQCPLRLVNAIRAHKQPFRRLVVFVDIGGNRDFESVVTLLAWLESGLPREIAQPQVIITKSEALYALLCTDVLCANPSCCIDLTATTCGGATATTDAGASNIEAWKQQTASSWVCCGHHVVLPSKWSTVKQLASSQIAARRQKPMAEGTASVVEEAAPAKKARSSCSGALGEKEEDGAKKVRANKQERASALAAALAASMSAVEACGTETQRPAAGGDIRRFPHPLKFPEQRTADGTSICRFHNYSERGCLRHLDPKGLGSRCPLDHEHCHACGAAGHIALGCPAALPLI